ncbi:MAG: PrsW family glutamic-type intramembrane protease [Patescibacteria group bacterium]|nr:PrsW family glutamic-type intramembrane protease [Patescibacteria group bacterium]
MFLDLLVTEPLKFLSLSLTLAIIPLAIWGYVFWRKHPIDRSLAVLTTIAGMMSVLPIWLYQWIFERYDHLDVFAAIKALSIDHRLIYLLTFVAVGIIEEQFKHWVVSWSVYHKKEWRGIADAIEFAVMAALGFAFIENIVYFLGIIKLEGFRALIVPFVFRSALSTFAHIFFSGVYGYHFGIAKHAKEWMIEEMGPKHHHKFFITKMIYKLLRVYFFNIIVRILAVCASAWLIWGLIMKLQWPVMTNASETLLSKGIVSGVGLILICWLLIVLFKFWHHVRRIHLDEILLEEETMEGLFLAMFFHAIFNFVLWLEWTWLIPVYLLCGYLYLAYELKLRENLMDFEAVDEKIESAERGYPRRRIVSREI